MADGGVSFTTGGPGSGSIFPQVLHDLLVPCLSYPAGFLLGARICRNTAVGVHRDPQDLGI